MSTFVFAETCVFGKQSLEPIACSLLALLTLLRHPFFQRYGVNLPSSLTEVRSFTWGEFSLPTSVGLRYGQKYVWLEAFLDGMGIDDFRLLAQARPNAHVSETGICLDLARHVGSRSCPFERFTLLTASPHHSSRRFLVQDCPTCLPSPTTMTSSA
jgi:hypothetical protein